MILLDQLRRDEGCMYEPYQDTLGNWTIGIGHKILPEESFLAPITDSQANGICAADIAAKQVELEALEWYNALDQVRQAAITNMAFNIGTAGVCEFHNMITCLQNSDWLGASDQALFSTWAKQVGARAVR